MDADGRPVQAQPRRAAGRLAAVRGWPGLFYAPAGTVVVWLLGEQTRVVWATQVALLFMLMTLCQLGVLVGTVAADLRPAVRRRRYVQVHTGLVAVFEVAVLATVVASVLADPAGSVPAGTPLPVFVVALVPLAAATVWNVRVAWRMWISSR